MNDFDLQKLKPATKRLIQCFLLFLLAGYGVALLMAYDKTHFDIGEVLLSYRGSENPDLMAFPKPYRELLQTTHTHILVVPILYFILSGLFLGTRLSECKKKFWISTLFLGLALEYLSLWGLRFFHEFFVWGTFSGNGITSLAYLYMCLQSFRALAKKP